MKENQSVSLPGAVVTLQDFSIPYSWKRVIATLQAAAKRATKTASGKTYAILTVHIVVDKHGKPIRNSYPRFTRLEPRSDDRALEELLEVLAG